MFFVVLENCGRCAPKPVDARSILVLERQVASNHRGKGIVKWNYYTYASKAIAYAAHVSATHKSLKPCIPFSAHIMKVSSTIERNKFGDIEYFLHRRFVTKVISLAAPPTLFVKLECRWREIRFVSS